MFEKASRMKLKFKYKGLISVEDLWDLRLESLNEIYKVLNKTLKESTGESLLEEKSSEDEVLSLRIDIIKHIVATKKAEQNAAKDAAKKSLLQKRVREIIANKENAELEGMSIEDLKKMIED